jgi:peptide/nickel transport system ATP-binding protein
MSNTQRPTESGIATAATTGRDPVLEVRDASVTFDMDRGESKVLDGVSVDIERNEILGIVGESGSGKSMFADSLLDAIVAPGQLSGEITYHPEGGEPVEVLELDEEERREFRWEQVSMVFQGAMSSFNPVKTIRGHFADTLEAHDRDEEEGMAYGRQLLTDLHLDADRVLDSYPHELSGGMKQRALIALSLVLDPEVLVMDEPTAALDLLMQQSILRLLGDLKEKYDLTVVFITHDLPLVAGLADRLAVMYAFEFVEIGPSDEIVERAAHPYTRALLRAVPNLSASLSTMQPIEGSSPDPVNVPAGCSYHTRCPLADDQCIETDPGFYETGADHAVKCHYWEQSIEEIQLHADADTEVGSRTAVETGSRRDRSTEGPVVSLDDVDVHFERDQGLRERFFGGDPDVVHALDDVSLDIHENDVVGLVGESGCGKTTLGKAAIGLQRPTDGAVRYRDQDIWDAKDGRGTVTVPHEDIRRSLQIIHQDPGSSLNPNKIILRTLEAPLKRWEPALGAEDRHARIFGLLKTVGMTPAEDYAYRYPHQLSGGEKQRVALLRALLMRPDLILADEAVSALDVSLRVEVMDLMLDLQEQFDTSYLAVSHDLSNARYFAGKAGGRIAVMYLGEIVEVGPAEEIIENPLHPYTEALRWSTPDLDIDADRGEPPIRAIDVPDSTNPPSGCRFHTRCPHAREVCTEATPELAPEGGDASADGMDKRETAHRGACFRVDPDHEYWDSDSIVEDED